MTTHTINLTSPNTTIDINSVAGGPYNFDINAVPSSNQSGFGPHTDDHAAGETITVMQLVELRSDGAWYLADADATGEANGLLGIAIGSGAAGEYISVALPNSFVRDDSWSWTVGAAIYVSTTPGSLTQVPSTNTDDVVRIIGWSTHANRLFFFPQTSILVHA